MVLLRRETGTWRRPTIAFACLTVLAWLMAYPARTATTLVSR
ncbi:hypothetical protein ABZ892_29235 [Streptomyces sp. NPDC046924]